MKVSIGTNIKDGPWGGGNLFAINLSNFLRSKGIEVIYDLEDDDIDIILITEPRKTSESSSFTHFDVENYLKYINFETIVIHRINECDERKNTNYVNKYLIYANKIADETIFVSKWLRDLYIKQGIRSKVNHVVYAGANNSIFNKENFLYWDKNEKIKLVTHHWGANWNKGFNSYNKIDQLLGTAKWKNRLAFTYIGNVHKKANFENSKIIEPLSGDKLGNELKSHHIYITGSINEPSGNHHIEASQCGLPILYINSGGVSEYCKGYGVEYNDHNLELKLEELISNYDHYVEVQKNYPNSSDKMAQEFLNIFENAIENKEKYIQERQISKNHSKFKLNSYLFRKKLFRK